MAAFVQALAHLLLLGRGQAVVEITEGGNHLGAGTLHLLGLALQQTLGGGAVNENVATGTTVGVTAFELLTTQIAKLEDDAGHSAVVAQITARAGLTETFEPVPNPKP